MADCLVESLQRIVSVVGSTAIFSMFKRCFAQGSFFAHFMMSM
jgi:hypothetical protein